MLVSETETADGMLMLITIRCPVRAVPHLATRDSSLSTLGVPALDTLQARVAWWYLVIH